MKNLTTIVIILLSFLFVSVVEASPRRIATFNIQNLGQTKMNNQPVVNSIVSVIRSYDIIAIQEISDISGETPERLLNAINGVQNDYGVSVSPRSGQQPDDASKAEQYAFYYREDLYELLGSQLYNDFQYDYFSREPWIVRFRHIESGITFIAITVHIDPNRVISEVNALHQVVYQSISLWPEEQNVIILGDMNADCRYATPTQLDTTALRSHVYNWIIPDTADTNVSTTSCAYDRIVLSNYFYNFYTGTWGVNTTITKEVSDHWPVWFELDL